MEVSSHLKFNNFLFRPSTPLRLCTKETRLFYTSPRRPLCDGLYMGSSPLKPAIRRNTVDYVPDSILFSPRNYSNATWCSFIPKFATLYHDNKFHNQDNLSRYIVVRSELVGTGSPDASYPLSAPHSGSKIRGICFYAVTSVAAVFLFVLMLVAHPFILLLDRYRRKAHYLIAKIWALATVTPFIEFEYEGLENLPAPDTPAVYVSNHQSFLDIYTLLTLGRSFKFISKTSIFYYPVIGWAMFLMGVIPLKRMDSRSQLECLKRCMDLVKKGASVFFFPEGTRSKDGNLTKVESLKLNQYSGLGSLDSLKYGGSKLKLQLKFGRPSQSLSQPHALVLRCNYPQNADLPRYYSKKEKKPFPIPILELRRAARERFKNRKGQPKRPAPPPKNGLVVKSLIPLAYEVLNARVTLINNLKKLSKVVLVHACKWCNEIHVGPVGHPFKSCRGQGAPFRKGTHEWTNAVVEDILVPIEAYHLFDRLGNRMPHEERFSIPRIPAIVELCIQAGVDLPEFPTKRRRKPMIRIGKHEFVDADESELPDLEPEPPKIPLLTELPADKIVPPANAEETALLAEETLQAWEKLRRGAKKLMRMYTVRVCGYCPEVHVGPSGHKAQNCGAHKHQQRNGQHGWQAAVIDDLIPPRYVWHVPDVNKPVLERELRNFYGQAPAVVEICVQGGAAVPEQYLPTMRLDVGIPTSVKEAEMVV